MGDRRSYSLSSEWLNLMRFVPQAHSQAVIEAGHFNDMPAKSAVYVTVTSLGTKLFRTKTITSAAPTWECTRILLEFLILFAGDSTGH